MRQRELLPRRRPMPKARIVELARLAESCQREISFNLHPDFVASAKRDLHWASARAFALAQRARASR